MKSKILSILITFFCILVNCGYAEGNKWEKIALEVETWTDRLGMPIDEHIKEVVIALNAVDIVTMQSCEGHFDHGEPYPWVSFDFSNEETVALNKERFELGEKLQLAQDEEQMLKIYSSIHALDKKLEVAHHLLAKPLFDLITAFNTSKPRPFDQQLYLEPWGFLSGHMNLQCIGSAWECLNSLVVQKEKCITYQNVLKEFAAFIRNQHS